MDGWKIGVPRMLDTQVTNICHGSIRDNLHQTVNRANDCKQSMTDARLHPCVTDIISHAMRCRSSLKKPLLLAASLLALVATPAIAKPKISGLEFPIGQSADRPLARVFIAELGQSAQKRGFFRVALLPAVSASGVKIQFLLPEPAVLTEIPATLRSIASMEAQELHKVTFLAPNDPAVRLSVEEVFMQRDHWQLKRVKWTTGGAQGEASECQLLLRGPECGKFVVPDATPPIPTLQELLQPRHAP